MAKRVYFAFDYEDVADFRANVVRKHNFTGGVEKAGYFDASIWEEAKQKDPAALKRLINAELEYTSVTAVLIGSDTWRRRWVRYEIMKSVERGNRVIGIHINSIRGKDQATKALGPNPFDNLGLQREQNAPKVKPTEWNGSQWIWYADLDGFPLPNGWSINPGEHVSLARFCPVYDWTAQSGYNSFQDWIT